MGTFSWLQGNIYPSFLQISVTSPPYGMGIQPFPTHFTPDPLSPRESAQPQPQQPWSVTPQSASAVSFTSSSSSSSSPSSSGSSSGSSGGRRKDSSGSSGSGGGWTAYVDTDERVGAATGRHPAAATVTATTASSTREGTRQTAALSEEVLEELQRRSHDVRFAVCFLPSQMIMYLMYAFLGVRTSTEWPCWCLRASVVCVAT